LARLKAADGDLRGAQEMVDRILSERPAMSAGDALALASSIDRRGLRGAAELLEGTEGVAEDPAVLFTRAMRAAADGRVDEGKALLTDARTNATDRTREAVERAYAQYLDAVNDPGATDALRALSEAFRASPAAQVDVLRSRSAWADAALIKQAVDNLRAAIGEQSPAWRVHEGR